MQLKQILLLSAIIFTVSPAFAELTTDEAVSTEYLIRYGHSVQMADVIQKEKSDTMGLPYKTITKKKNIFQRFFGYIDPGIDEGLLERHNIRPGASITDY